MGAGFNALAAAGVQQAQNQANHNRDLQDQLRQQNLQRNWGILNDPSATPEMKQAAGQDIQNQYPTPAHKGTFLSDVFHIHSGQTSAPPIPAAAPPPVSTPNPISGAPSTPDQGAKDQLGVPFNSGQPPAADSAPPTPPPASSIASPSPSAPTSHPDLSAVAAAPTPQAAMSLWQQYRGPQAIAEEHAKNAAGFAQALADTNNAARIQEATIRAHGNVSMQKMDAAAQSLGAEDFASATPEIKMQAMKAVASANRAPAWKSVTDGNSIYAVNSLDPTQRTLLGHKDDLTQRQEFRTMTNPDGSTFLVPVTVWSKKGSSTPVMETQDDQGGAPVSASTPQGPGGTSQVPAAATPSATSASPSAMPQSGAPVSAATPEGVPGTNLGARQPGSKPAGAAVKTAPTRIPSSTVGAPIPFGGKPSELTKSDTSQYTKLAEDANAKQEALGLAQQAARSPSPSSDQQLIYSWVRANVQGAGRMTQQEFTQAARIGSLGDKAQNYWSLLTSGKMTPNIRQMLLADIQRSAQTSQSLADNARAQVQQDMNPSKPTSSKTPKAPGAAPKSAADYLKSIGVQ